MKLLTRLLDHQQKAVKKLLRFKVGALYMEMGTGKTRTVLEMIKFRLEHDRIDRVLWLCPYSVKETLRREITKHTGSFPECIDICGIETLSVSNRENLKLLSMVCRQRYFLVVDESSLVKNPYSFRTRNITRLSAHCEYRLILNGFQAAGSEADLFSQWNLLDWRILGYRNYYSFAANHLQYDERFPGWVVRSMNVEYLTKRIAPYTYQILKKDCLNIPDKIYEQHAFSLTQTQDTHYTETAERFFQMLDEIRPETVYRLFTALQAVTSGRAVTVESKNHFITRPFFETPKENPRVLALLELAGQSEEKTVIFCKFMHEVEELFSVLRQSYGAERVAVLHGKLDVSARQNNIDALWDSARFLVVSKRCAEYGLNLQCATRAIFYDNDFDFATRIRAEDRLHRIGQTKNVHIVDLYCKETIDVKILECLRKKSDLVATLRSRLDREKDNSGLTEWIYGGTEDGQAIPQPNSI